MSAYVGSSKNLKELKDLKVKCDPKAKVFYLQSFLRKGVSLGGVGRNQNLKDLKDQVIRKEAWPFYRTSSGVRLCWELEEPKGLEEDFLNNLTLRGPPAGRRRLSARWPCAGSTGYLFGYGYCLPPYGTAYRSALHTTRAPVSYPLGGAGVTFDPNKHPRQVLGPFGMTSEPTRHIRDRVYSK